MRPFVGQRTVKPLSALSADNELKSSLIVFGADIEAWITFHMLPGLAWRAME